MTTTLTHPSGKAGSQIGRSIPRLEGRDKVTGQAEYTHLMRLPGMLHAKLFRSTVAHGRINSVDTSVAKQLPGVLHVVTIDDIKQVIPDPYYGPAFHDQPILADGRVRFVGEPVAVVLARDPHVAEQAVQLISAEYEELPAIYDEVEAFTARTFVHDELKPAATFPDLKHLKGVSGTNVALDYRLRRGDFENAYAAAAQNIRVQEGLREQFHEGLLRSRYYKPSMERIFRSAGLPPELVTLASVESGFHNGSRSSAGAVGIWQFTRDTGKHYMKITRYHDDRLSPERETLAAAKLLRSNYDTLGDWPLAITAYNYGTGGVARAAGIYGGDYSEMVQHYQGPHFGFAVKNYYAEFLAALQVHRDEEKYFPGIEDEPAIRPAPIRTDFAPPRRSKKSHGSHAVRQASAKTKSSTKTHHSKKTLAQKT